MLAMRRERAEIVSALHKSASDLHRGLTTCNNFTRSHSLRKIMSMCADRRSDFSTDEYHRHDHGNSGIERIAVETEPDDMVTVWSTSGEAADRRRWSSSHIGGASRCWSCTATDRETDDDDDVDEDNSNVTTDEAHYHRTSENHRLSWTQKLTRNKIRNSRNSR